MQASGTKIERNGPRGREGGGVNEQILYEDFLDANYL